MYARTDTGAVVALIPKAGMQSIRDATCHREDLPLDVARAASVRVVFLREPAERLRSAYRFFRMIYEKGSMASPNSPQPEDVASWDAFMAYVRANPDDPHWRPQAHVVREFQPTVMHRFEQADDYWHRYNECPLPHKNWSKRCAVGEIPPDIIARYVEDEALWRGL